jgi:tight adherence protein C
VSLSRSRTADALRTIDAYGFSAAPVGERGARGATRGVFDAVAHAVGALATARLSSIGEDKVRAQLMAAGYYETAPRRFVGYRVLCALVVPLVLVYALASIGAPSGLGAVMVTIGAILGWRLPMIVVQRRPASRYEQVERDLPELIDLLVVTVEAGLGFSAALSVASGRVKGPLGDELRLALQEQNMGLSTQHALRNMLARCETPSMRAFVRSILQGETLGVSIGQIMRNLALEMRKRRRAHAEERAQKAPVKLLFPLIFLIFPAMFIVLLGPAVFNFLDTFGGRL